MQLYSGQVRELASPSLRRASCRLRGRCAQLSVALLCCVPGASVVAGQPSTTIKFAMIAPERSVWGRQFKVADREIRVATGGEVGLKIFAGGVQGDEPAIVRKMRIGQLHGAGFMARGINLVCPDSTVFSIPLLFQSEAEADHALKQMTPYLREKASEKGYEIIAWTKQGFAYLFSKDDVRDIPALRRARPWFPEDDHFSEALFRAAGVSAVPANVGDVLTGLQSGLIHTVFTPAVGLIAMQWHTRMRYRLDQGLFYSFGAVVISQRQWRRISPERQQQILGVFRRNIEVLNEEVTQQNAEALNVIANTVTTVQPTAAALVAFRELNEAVVRDLKGKMFSAKAFDMLRSALAEYRAKDHAAE